MTVEIDKEELKKRLTPLQWHVTQEKGTERYVRWKFNLFIINLYYKSYYPYLFYKLYICINFYCY